MLASLACDADDDQHTIQASDRAGVLGIDAFRGSQDGDEARYELLDADEKVVGSYEWVDEGEREVTIIEFGEREFEYVYQRGSAFDILVDGVAIGNIATSTEPNATVEGGMDLKHGLDLFAATQGDLGLGAFDSIAHDLAAYGQRVCFSVTVFGYTYEYCFELPDVPPCSSGDGVGGPGWGCMSGS